MSLKPLQAVKAWGACPVSCAPHLPQPAALPAAAPPASSDLHKVEKGSVFVSFVVGAGSFSGEGPQLRAEAASVQIPALPAFCSLTWVQLLTSMPHFLPL